MEFKIFLRLTAGCPVPLLSPCGGKSKDETYCGLSLKPPVILSSFALSDQRFVNRRNNIPCLTRVSIFPSIGLNKTENPAPSIDMLDWNSTTCRLWVKFPGLTSQGLIPSFLDWCVTVGYSLARLWQPLSASWSISATIY